MGPGPLQAVAGEEAPRAGTAVRVEEYLGGLLDLTGELMRSATAAAGRMDTAHVTLCGPAPADLQSEG